MAGAVRSVWGRACRSAVCCPRARLIQGRRSLQEVLWHASGPPGLARQLGSGPVTSVLAAGRPTPAKHLREEQLTSHVLMIEPSGFCSNAETRQDNKFMAEAAGSEAAAVKETVMQEWSALVRSLQAAGVQVTTFEGQGLPDEVFPNNWFSTHSNGRLVLYPMKVPSRAKEVRQDVIERIRSASGLSKPVLDLTSWRMSGVALEGTGSLVLDRASRIAYVALSKRADLNLARLWAADLGYELVAFGTRDRLGEEIYHTNVLLSVGINFAVVCLEAIPALAEREALLASLRRTGKAVVPVSLQQMESFAGNCLQLRGDGTVLAISDAGWSSLDATQRVVLESLVDRVVVAKVPTLERLGGGSVRCMIAELFEARPAGAGPAPISVAREAEPEEAEAAAGRVCSVDSEWGKLELVLVHEPGLEVDAVMPWTLDTMKVDECFNRVDLKAQHRVFSRLLRSRGAQVVHVRDLLTEISQQGEDSKRKLFESVWGEESVNGLGLRHLHVDHLVTGYSRRALEFEFPPLMNLFFMRDPVFSVPGGWAVIARPYYPIRQMESKLLKAVFKLHPAFKNVPVYEGLADDPDVHIEGGDVLVADNETVLVGISQRTNERGADRLAEFLFQNTPVTRVIKVFIPKQRAFMHLDTLFTFIDKGTVLTMPYFWSKPEVYAEVARRANSLNAKMGSEQRQDAEEWVQEPPRIEMLVKGEARPKKYRHAMSGLQAEGVIEKALFVCGPEGSWRTPEEHVARALTEQWNDAANVFCISPGTVVAYKWCTRTVSHLQDNGIDVIELDGAELMKGRGGARCMTFPLRRSIAMET